jgi:prepilin-type processing-associated H-X9-DG protein
MMPYIKNNAIFACPSDAKPTPSKDINGNLTILRSYIAVCPAESLTLAQVDDPVETMVVTEKWSTVTDSWIEPFNGDFTPDPVDPRLMWTSANRHTGLINCAFFDGHAKALPAGDIQSSKDLTGCNEIYRYPFGGVNPPTMTSPTSNGQPNACASFQYN